jgi:hypothetical protein
VDERKINYATTARIGLHFSRVAAGKLIAANHGPVAKLILGPWMQAEIAYR